MRLLADPEELFLSTFLQLLHPLVMGHYRVRLEIARENGFTGWDKNGFRLGELDGHSTAARCADDWLLAHLV